MQNLKIKLNSESEAEEVKRLAVKAGYTLDALFGRKWSAEFCYLVLCENMAAGFANEIMADGDKPLSIGELWAVANQDQDEPFLTPETTLNDQYAEIEQVRQATKDNVNHPSHYADSAIECIDAMEAMMTPEQFIGYLRGNLFKYQWRYEKKNGIEDLKKAQWYLEKLTVKVAEKNAPF